MVLSASSVDVARCDRQARSPYSIFISQAVFAASGAVALVVASRIVGDGLEAAGPPDPRRRVRAAAARASPRSGRGQRQPRTGCGSARSPCSRPRSIKVGLVLAGGLDPGREAQARWHSLSHVVVPVPRARSPRSASVLVLLGHDLGTVLIMGAHRRRRAVRRRASRAAGSPSPERRSPRSPSRSIVTSPNRLRPVRRVARPRHQQFGAARQPIHGRYALADGGWFGLGLGASREKWRLLSEPHNDFIFAIIGEELGLPGTIASSWGSSPSSRWPATGWSRARTTSSCGSRRPASWPGSSSRRSSTSAP